MHHYPFHPGDYMLDTAHLLPMHDLCYRRALDLYYVSEEALPNDKQLLSKRLRIDEQVLAEILTEFFTLTEKGWEQAKCEHILAKYHATSQARKQAGSLGGAKKSKQKRSKSKQLLNNSQANASNQEPETRNQEPVFPPDYPAGHVAALSRWWSYKREKRETYKPTGWETLLKQQAVFTADQVQRAVEASIGSNYAGLFTDKIAASDLRNPLPQKKEGAAVFVEVEAPERFGEAWIELYGGERPPWATLGNGEKAEIRRWIQQNR
jgi:uncharacterized protein YdaU (DUF1376 family)